MKSRKTYYKFLGRIMGFHCMVTWGIMGSVPLIIFLVNILKFENKLVSLPQKIINNEMT